MNDKGRYGLCLQCLQEMVANAKSKDEKFIEFRLYVIDIIWKAIKSNKKWVNIMGILVFGGSHKDKLCFRCPYAAEHVVLACKPLKVEKE